jgi:hypothetical protein
MNAGTESLPFPRGTTASAGLATVDTTVLANLEGKEYVVEDEDPATATARTGRQVKLRMLRNKSGFALLPKKTCKYSTNTADIYPSHVRGHGHLTAERVAIVDEYLPAAGVADGDLFYGVIEGPSLCLTDLAGGANNLIPIGTSLVSLTAATSNATTAGRVAPQDLTGATGLLGNQLQNRIGVAITAMTTSQTNAGVLVDVGGW